MSHLVDAHVAYCKAIADLIRDKVELLERIKRLEEELTDTKNKHSVLVADVVLYEDRADRIKRLEDAGDALFELCDASPIQFELVDQIPQRLKAWEEAKEAKL